jgi:hypothetical protein
MMDGRKGTTNVNYTALPVGMKIDDGEIAVCTECGQNGLRQVSGLKEFFTHVQGSGVDPKTGDLLTGWVMHERLLPQSEGSESPAQE